MVGNMSGKQMTAMRVALFLCVISCFPGAAFALDSALWEAYKSTFISGDGRVIDVYQDHISHSEGQGYGMLLAVAYDDRGTFEKLWQWSRNNLAKRMDNLLAWGWGKRPNGDWDILDYNNATDGDILVAYALLKASKRWGDDGYREKGLAIAESIKRNLAVDVGDLKYLIPGYHGYIKDDGVVLNPSYSVFPAFRLFAKESDRAFWDKIYQDSLFLISQNVFGKMGLPADWVVINKEGLSIYSSNGKKPRFGYEAIRTFLYLGWEDKPAYPAGLKKLFEFYGKLGYLPRWVDLKKNSVSLEPGSGGFYAVYAAAANRTGEKELGKKLFNEAREKLGKEKDNYYSHVLYLLAESDDPQF